MRRRYRFVSGWQVPLAPEEVWRRVRAALVAGAAPGWRAVRVTTTRLEPGSTMHMLVRSPLGFRLRMRILLTDVTAPSRIAARSRGDLDGVGTLEITPTPGGSAMTWIWQVEPTRRGMRVAGVVLHPLFSLAHRMVMAQGRRGFVRAIASEPRNAGNRGSRRVRGRAAG